MELCCFSTVLFLAAAACPYIVHKAYVKPVQHVLALVAFPLVGVILSSLLSLYMFYVSSHDS